jgi:protocatechuate 3,4-dioxygenase, beta subunit
VKREPQQACIIAHGMPAPEPGGRYAPYRLPPINRKRVHCGKLTGMDVDPPYDCAAYRSTEWRAPKRPLLPMPKEMSQEGPVFGPTEVTADDADLIKGSSGEPLGERIIVAGRVRDSAGRPIRGQLVEIWQANAAGRYRHEVDRHPAPLDPNFTGAGRCLTGDDGSYKFLTIKPGPYPWGNHANAWRPAHIHFSVFGTSFADRLVTQMYFPGDPLLELDPMFMSVRDREAAGRLVASLDMGMAVENWALAYAFDIVVGP